MHWGKRKGGKSSLSDKPMDREVALSYQMNSYAMKRGPKRADKILKRLEKNPEMSLKSAARRERGVYVAKKILQTVGALGLTYVALKSV
jgi:hypothetical protein